MTDARWLEARVAECRHWTDALFSLYVEADPVKFEAGQFAKLALPDLDGSGTEGAAGLIGRPYSFVNAPDGRPHEFFCVTVPKGPLSPRLAALKPGDPIFLARQPSGFLILSEVPDANSLWLICTGTGIGPFLSILRTEAPWKRYGSIVLVQCTRFLAEQTHRSIIESIETQHPSQFCAISLVTREAAHEGGRLMGGRIPQAISDGRIESVAGVPLQGDSAQVMLCGNPGMIQEVTGVLNCLLYTSDAADE